MTAKHIKVDFFKKVPGDNDYQHDGLCWASLGDSISMSASVEAKISADADGALVAITMVDGCVIRPNACGEIVIDCAVRAVLYLAEVEGEVKMMERIRRVLDV